MRAPTQHIDTQQALQLSGSWLFALRAAATGVQHYNPSCILMREGQKRLLDPEHASKATVSSWEDCLLHVMSLPGCLHLKFSLMSLLLCPSWKRFCGENRA